MILRRLVVFGAVMVSMTGCLPGQPWWKQLRDARQGRHDATTTTSTTHGP